MIVKNKEELDILKEAGKRLRLVLDELENSVKPGLNTKELDDLARRIMKDLKVEPSFLNYKPYGASKPYPASICTSVNEEVVHGIPNLNPRTLKEGDVVTIDAGIWFSGLCVDSARTVKVGKVSKEIEQLVEVAKKTTKAQINAAYPGRTPKDLGKASEKVIKSYGYSSPAIFGGHGVGRKVHEEPFIPNYAKYGLDSYKFSEGEVLALEPIVILGSSYVSIKEDGYTAVTDDSSWSAQFEHTVVLTKDGAIVLT